MNVMDVLSEIKSGATVMVTLSERAGCERQYSLRDGTKVSAKQFRKIEGFLRPVDGGLFGDEPQSYEWDG